MENKIKLKNLEKFEVISVDYGDLDNLVKEVYNNEDYEFVADEEMGNDSQKLYKDITGSLEDYDEKELERFKSGERHSYNTRVILEDLCRNGHIEPGNYLIKVCW